MSGSEVIGLISGIVAIIEASLRLYDAVDDASGLPQSFRDVATRLPLVQDTLKAACTGLAEADDIPSVESRMALTKVLESCRDKAASLQKVLQAVIPSTRAKRMERYLKALKTIPSADKVENLMDGIICDLQVLTSNRAVKAATQAQVESLIDWIKTGEKPKGCSSPAIAPHYSSSQYIHSGQGNQNVAMDGGIQVNGQSSGAFYFGMTPQ
ncbi:hypothetical protein F4810DRAFT_502374 [Camillea tinctor]|nr:hypothetical protein F4810DRAFT_502374 [Camillea tinctor]